MIPKKIHYFWFGGKEKSEDIKKYIDSWKKHLPEYEIIEWNETNFDLKQNKFVKEAYENKKWAFITDYGRLQVLYKYGGIYMDTDVEVVKNLDKLLLNKAFTGMEGNKHCVTGTMGGVKGHKWIKLLLSYYDDKSFFKEDGSLDTKTNTVIITNMTKKYYGWKEENGIQHLKDGLVIYPHEYLCAKSFRTGLVDITKNTYTIHHFKGSWLTEKTTKNPEG